MGLSFVNYLRCSYRVQYSVLRTIQSDLFTTSHTGRPVTLNTISTSMGHTAING